MPVATVAVDPSRGGEAALLDAMIKSRPPAQVKTLVDVGVKLRGSAWFAPSANKIVGPTFCLVYLQTVVYKKTKAHSCRFYGPVGNVSAGATASTSGACKLIRKDKVSMTRLLVTSAWSM